VDNVILLYRQIPYIQYYPRMKQYDSRILFVEFSRLKKKKKETKRAFWKKNYEEYFGFNSDNVIQLV
jgi:REP element-mobilizing transposase RayT